MQGLTRHSNYVILGCVSPADYNFQVSRTLRWIKISHCSLIVSHHHVLQWLVTQSTLAFLRVFEEIDALTEREDDDDDLNFGPEDEHHTYDEQNVEEITGRHHSMSYLTNSLRLEIDKLKQLLPPSTPSQKERRPSRSALEDMQPKETPPRILIVNPACRKTDGEQDRKCNLALTQRIQALETFLSMLDAFVDPRQASESNTRACTIEEISHRLQQWSSQVGLTGWKHIATTSLKANFCLRVLLHNIASLSNCLSNMASDWRHELSGARRCPGSQKK